MKIRVHFQRDKKSHYIYFLITYYFDRILYQNAEKIRVDYYLFPIHTEEATINCCSGYGPFTFTWCLMPCIIYAMRLYWARSSLNEIIDLFCMP